MTDYSYQLYSSRNFPPLGDTLRMLADIGYAQVEGYDGLFPPGTDLGALRADLDTNSLTMPTCHIGLDRIEADPAGIVDLARTLGIKAVFAPHLAAELRPGDSAGWANFGKRLAEAGKPLQDAGLRFGWHNHDFEFAALDGADRPLDLILQGGDHIALELDLAWVQRGGDDPLDWIKKWSDRIVAAHIKDIAPDGQAQDEDGWADVGHGVIDWAPLVAALRQTLMQYWVMEHDNPNDHTRFASRSLATANTF